MPGSDYAQLIEYTKEIERLNKEIIEHHGRLKRIEAKIAKEKRSGNSSVTDLEETRNDIVREINRKNNLLRSNSKNLIIVKQLLEQEPDPQSAIEQVSDKTPILLFPVRLEAKFRTALKQLWIRIIPDDVMIETHEPSLTEEEYIHGCRMQYLLSCTYEVDDEGSKNLEKVKKETWREFSGLFGAYRAAWIYKTIKENNLWEEKSEVFDCTEGQTDQLDHGEFPEDWEVEGLSEKHTVSTIVKSALWVLQDDTQNRYFVIEFGEDLVKLTTSVPKSLDDIELKPDSWSHAPVSKVLPDRFAVRLYQGDTLVKETWGNIIPQPLPVGPAPFSPHELGNLLDTFPIDDALSNAFDSSEKSVPREIENLIVECGYVLTESAIISVVEEDALYKIEDFFNELEFMIKRSDTEVEVYLRSTLFDEDSKWIMDFPAAVDVGMAVIVDFADMADDAFSDMLELGFSKVIALGVKTAIETEAAEETPIAQSYIEELINNHRFTEGFAFLKPEFETNNTSENICEGREDDAEMTYRLEYHDAVPLDEDTDGVHFANLLCIDHACLERIDNSSRKDYYYAGSIQGALWPVTWGYFLKYLMVDKGLQGIQEYLPYLKEHYVKFVRASGPLPIFRTGNMPYGILPVSSLSEWRQSNTDTEWIDDDDDKEKDYIMSEWLLKVLTFLKSHWETLAENTSLIPRIDGNSSDPEGDFLKILGMDSSVVSNRFRHFSTSQYMSSLLTYISGQLANQNPVSALMGASSGPAYGSSSTLIQGCIETLQTAQDNGMTFFRELLVSLGVSAQNARHITPFVSQLVAWGNGYPVDIPLVQDEGISPDNVLVEVDTSLEKKTYVTWLADDGVSNEDILNCSSEEKPPFSRALFFQLLRASILLENGRADEGSAKGYLKNLPATFPVKDAERYQNDVFSLSTNRLDSWINSFPLKRLWGLRSHEDTDSRKLGIGAFGWLLDLKPKQKEAIKGGYIHSPSLQHAATAAILRHKYISQPDQENAEAYAVHLSSDRVKRALWLLEGLRQGQTLGTLLGYRFEHKLGNEYKDNNGNRLELHQYIYLFRKLYPIKIPIEENTVEGEAKEATAPRNVVDGKALLEAYRENEIPFGERVEEGNELCLPGAGSHEQKAICYELEKLAELYDAASDLLLSESVYQAVGGNFERAGAPLNVLSGKATFSGTDVIRTPRGSLNSKFRALLLFTGDFKNEEIPAWPETPRGFIEPLLNRWAAKLLGSPENIKFGIKENPDADEYISVSIDDLKENNVKIGPLDLIYMLSKPVSKEATEVEERIAYYVRSTYPDYDVESKVKIKFEKEDDEDFYSIPEIQQLAVCLIDFIAQGRILHPGDVMLAEESDEAKKDQTAFTLEDIAEFKTRISESCNQLKNISMNLYGDLFTDDKLNNLWECSFDDVRKDLVELIGFNIPGSIPVSLSDDFEILYSINNPALRDELDQSTIPQAVRDIFPDDDVLSMHCTCSVVQSGIIWRIEDTEKHNVFFIFLHDGSINICTANTWMKFDQLYTQARAALKEAMKRVTIAEKQIANPGEDAIGTLSQAGKTLFGGAMVILPRFTPDNRDELTIALAHNNDLLDDELPVYPVLWLSQCAYTHPRIAAFDRMLMTDRAFSKTMELYIGQLPYQEDDRWAGLPGTEAEYPQGRLAFISAIPTGFYNDADQTYAGLVIDDWDEFVPKTKETTAIAYHYNKPNSEPPNALLLAVSPVIENEGGTWSWDTLSKIVTETIELVKVRSIDLDALKRVGMFLPALFIEQNVNGENNE